MNLFHWHLKLIKKIMRHCHIPAIASTYHNAVRDVMHETGGIKGELNALQRTANIITSSTFLYKISDSFY